jgi:hypothetical protein
MRDGQVVRRNVTSNASRTRRRRDTTLGRQVARDSVSELCQIAPETPVEDRDWRGHSDAHGCCGKALMRSALVRVAVRQHARPVSISKRAPSTTRTSLRIWNQQFASGLKQFIAKPSFKSYCSAMRFEFSGLGTLRRASSLKLCQTSSCPSITYGDFDPHPNRIDRRGQKGAVCRQRVVAQPCRTLVRHAD